MHADGSTMAETSELHAARAVLGLDTAPSSNEAKAAFRVRAALLHPDVHQGAGTQRMDAATAAMQQLNEAYQLVLDSLDDRDPNPMSVTQGDNGPTRRCTRCRREFQSTTTEAPAACPRCRQRSRVRSLNPRSKSRDGSRAGRVVVSSRRPRTRQRVEPLGRLAHVALWRDER